MKRKDPGNKQLMKAKKPAIAKVLEAHTFSTVNANPRSEKMANKEHRREKDKKKKGKKDC